MFQEKDKYDQAILELRRELHDNNIALSEARSLLAACERQERNNKERYESEIRDLQLKLHRSEVCIQGQIFMSGGNVLIYSVFFVCSESTDNGHLEPIHVQCIRILSMKESSQQLICSSVK